MGYIAVANRKPRRRGPKALDISRDSIYTHVTESCAVCWGMTISSELVVWSEVVVCWGVGGLLGGGGLLGEEDRIAVDGARRSRLDSRTVDFGLILHSRQLQV